MSIASSSSMIISCQKYSTNIYTKPCTRFPTLAWNPISRLARSSCKNNELIFSGGRYNNRVSRNPFVIFADTSGVPPPGPPSSSNNPIKWIIGLLVSFIFPIFCGKMGPLRVIKTKLEKAVQTVEDIAEAVEKVAENVDKIAEDISDDLPAGKLKDLIDLVENVAEKTAKTADQLDDVIDKVQDVGDQVDDIVEAALKEAKESKAAKAG